MPRLKLDGQSDVKIPIQTTEPPKTEPKKEEPKKDDKDNKGIMHTMKENAFVIFLFAVIIIGLLILVAYLVTRNDSYFSWFKGNKPDSPPAAAAALMDAAKKKAAKSSDAKDAKPKKDKMSHSDIMSDVSDEELAKYAAGAASKAKDPKEQKEAKDSKEAKNNKDPKESSASKEEKKVTFGADHVISIEDVDNDTERTMSGSQDIEAIIADSLAKMASEFRKVAQLDPTSGSTVKVFETADTLTTAGFALDDVVKCCADASKSYKNFKWKYVS